MNLESAGEIKTKNMVFRCSKHFFETTVFRCSKHVHDVSGLSCLPKGTFTKYYNEEKEESRTVKRNTEFKKRAVNKPFGMVTGLKEILSAGEDPKIAAYLMK